MTPADVRHSIEREFAIPFSAGSAFFSGLVGAAACEKAVKPCDLSRGIVVDPAKGTVTFRLTAADPEFPYKLATPAGAVVPRNAPRAESRRPLPATGPYMIASYDRRRGMRLVRNPYFHVWSAAAKPDGYVDELRWTFQASNDKAIDAVVAGRADVLYPTVGTATARADELATQYPALVHSTPDPASAWVVVNTSMSPFDDVRVRRAVNYALDRGKLVRLHGGPLAAQANCQILPPNFPGYRPYCPYTLGPTTGGTWSAPDLAKAKALVRASGTRGAKVRLDACACIHPEPEIRYMRNVLEQLGYRVTLHLLPDIPTTIKRQEQHPQAIFLGWIADYPAASNFFVTTTCGTPANIGRFCDRALDRGIKRAIALQERNPQAARELWAKLDAQATDEAPLINAYTERYVELVSKRVGNYQHNPLYSILLDQLWVR